MYNRLLKTAAMRRANACEVFGTKMTFSRRSAFRYFTGYGSRNGRKGAAERSARFILMVSTNERMRMRSGPGTSDSSTFSTSGDLSVISCMMRTISSERYASWPHPKLTICAYSKLGSCAAMTAVDSMRA